MDTKQAIELVDELLQDGAAMTHTRGPWSVYELANDSDTYGNIAGLPIVTANNDDTEVCGACFNPADAKLIACAPDLLESLESMVSNLLEAHQSELDDCHGGDAALSGEAPEACSYCKDIAEARAIIERVRS